MPTDSDKTTQPKTDLAIAMERIAELELELDKYGARLKTAEGALFQVIGQFKDHSHDSQGRAVVPAVIS